KKTKYAIKALVALAKSERGVPILISRLAEEERIPKKFLELILLELRNAGVLHSKKGAGGGYYLAKDPAEVKLVQILRVTDGPIALLPCVSLNFYERCEECKDEVTCGIRNVFIDVREVALGILSDTSIADIVSREKKLCESINLTT
ncbi:MAG TPA: Rrf2 family transcriptional regulator, partial [Anseongella sp.]|nr:Rrf2 family transcriptional regulator [Anseongella sp.]